MGKRKKEWERPWMRWCYWILEGSVMWWKVKGLDIEFGWLSKEVFNLLGQEHEGNGGKEADAATKIVF